MLVVVEEWVVLVQELVEMVVAELEKMEFVMVMVQQVQLTLEAVVEDLQVEFLAELVVAQE